MTLLTQLPEADTDERAPRPETGLPRPLPGRSHRALCGIKLGVRKHSSFSVHFFFAVLILAVGVVLRCGAVDWCILVGCLSLLLITELFHSAVEVLVQALDRATAMRAIDAVNITTGAVLMARVTAAIVGGIVFFSRLLEFFSWRGSA